MKRVIGSMASAALCATTLTGCWVERPCSDGSFPVTGTGTNSGGATCVKNGDPVPTGYGTYPSGHTPTRAEDMFPSSTSPTS